jgi:hypothetical protein
MEALMRRHVDQAFSGAPFADDAERRGRTGPLPPDVGRINSLSLSGGQGAVASRGYSQLASLLQRRFVRPPGPSHAPRTAHPRHAPPAPAALFIGRRQYHTQLVGCRPQATCGAVLLLDEATAVIDGTSDAASCAALREHILPAGTAVITIAHRLATARDADRVIPLNDGHILEAGIPAALPAADTAFAALCALEDAGWDRHHEPATAASLTGRT